MNFARSLPREWQVDDLFGTPGRINMLREGVVTLVGVKRLESEALFVSSEGGGTLRETAKVDFAGQERYWWLARKVAGVLRRVLLSELQPESCTVDNPCVNCQVCGLLGALSTDTNRSPSPRSLSSRVKLQDLISVEPYVYDEKFRVRLPEDPNDPKKGNPTPFQEIIVPPGTHFPFIVRIVKPSQFDIGAFLYANHIADAIGYGNYSKLRGNATTQWVAIFDGFAYASLHELLLGQQDLFQGLEELAKQPGGPVKTENTLSGNDLVTYLKEVTSSREKWIQ
jgi:hypothetical protein